LEKTLLLFSYSSTLEERDWRDNEKWEEESPPPYSSSQMENVSSTETNIRKERERMRHTHNDVREREKNDQYYSLSLSLCVCVCMWWEKSWRRTFWWDRQALSLSFFFYTAPMTAEATSRDEETKWNKKKRENMRETRTIQREREKEAIATHHSILNRSHLYGRSQPPYLKYNSPKKKKEESLGETRKKAF
jgi:hypothetical protein